MNTVFRRQWARKVVLRARTWSLKNAKILRIQRWTSPLSTTAHTNANTHTLFSLSKPRQIFCRMFRIHRFPFSVRTRVISLHCRKPHTKTQQNLLKNSSFPPTVCVCVCVFDCHTRGSLSKLPNPTDEPCAAPRWSAACALMADAKHTKDFFFNRTQPSSLLLLLGNVFMLALSLMGERGRGRIEECAC